MEQLYLVDILQEVPRVDLGVLHLKLEYLAGGWGSYLDMVPWDLMVHPGVHLVGMILASKVDIDLEVEVHCLHRHHLVGIPK